MNVKNKNMTNQEQKQQEREATQAIAHFSGLFNTGVYFYQINYWERVWDKCNPFLFSNESKEKEDANAFMLNVLEYHLQNTINMDERKRISDKIRMLK